jgi:hypothetical protein
MAVSGKKGLLYEVLSKLTIGPSADRKAQQRIAIAINPFSRITQLLGHFLRRRGANGHAREEAKSLESCD